MGNKKTAAKLCHCGNQQTFDDCCGAIISGNKTASTAEQLMRSRYSAFVVQDKAYLLASWHPDQRPLELDFDPQQQWIGLKIVRKEAGQAGDETGVVEFVARYKLQGKAYRLEEVSQFECVDGQWLYTTGLVN